MIIDPETLTQLVKTLIVQLTCRYLAKELIPDDPKEPEEKPKKKRPRKQAPSSKASKRAKGSKSKG